MSISFRTGSNNFASSGSTQVASQTLTLPSVIQSGDTVWIVGVAVTLTTTVPTQTASSTATTPVAETGTGVPVSGTESVASFSLYLWSIDATSSDANATVTITPSANAFMAAACAAYPGGNALSPIDVIQGVFGGASTGTVTLPTKITGVANAFALYIGGGAAEGGSTFTGPTTPAGTTSRVDSVSSADVAIGIFDSNASLASGTSIGGGTFSAVSPTNSLLGAITISFKPASGASFNASLTISSTAVASFGGITTHRTVFSAMSGSSVTFGAKRTINSAFLVVSHTQFLLSGSKLASRSFSVTATTRFLITPLSPLVALRTPRTSISVNYPQSKITINRPSAAIEVS